jgi:hypothetical protein
MRSHAEHGNENNPEHGNEQKRDNEEKLEAEASGNALSAGDWERGAEGAGDK